MLYRPEQIILRGDDATFIWLLLLSGMVGAGARTKQLCRRESQGREDGYGLGVKVLKGSAGDRELGPAGGRQV